MHNSELLKRPGEVLDDRDSTDPEHRPDAESGPHGRENRASDRRV